MGFCRPVRITVLGALVSVSALCGQATPARVAIGGGLLLADHGRDGFLRSPGVAGFLRLNLTSFPLLLDASVEHAPQNRDIEAVTCPLPPVPCANAFAGPTTALTFAPAVQGTKRESPTSGVAWLFRLGPSVSWRVHREAGSEPFAVGVRGGVSAKVGYHRAGVLLSADFFRLFRAGSSQEWFLPITVGWQF